MPHVPLHLVLLGPPAAGKGTQAALIAKKYGCVPVSTGDLMRNMKHGNVHAEEISRCMREGRLVPDAIVCQLVQERLRLRDCVECGFLLDGFPRNLSQAIMLRKTGVVLHGVVHLDVAAEVTLERIVGRVVDSETGESYHLKSRPPPPERRKFMRRRRDDTEKVGRQRLAVYARAIEPLVAHYRRQPRIALWTFRITDGTRTVDSIFKAIERRLDTLLRSREAPVDDTGAHAGAVPPQSPAGAANGASGDAGDSQTAPAAQVLGPCGGFAAQEGRGCGWRQLARSRL